MGKSPGTVAGSIVKNRENKLRRIAASHGMRLEKYRDARDGRPYVLAYVTPLPDPYWARGRTHWAPPGSKRLEQRMTLDEVEQLLRAGGL